LPKTGSSGGGGPYLIICTRPGLGIYGYFTIFFLFILIIQ